MRHRIFSSWIARAGIAWALSIPLALAQDNVALELKPKRGPCQKLDAVEFYLAQFASRPERLPSLSLTHEQLGSSPAILDFPTVIRIPLELQKSVGFSLIRKIKKLGNGGMGTVYEVEATDLLGNVQHLAWRELKAPPDEHFAQRAKRIHSEIAGAQLQYRAGANPDSHIVPALAHIQMGESDGFLMRRGSSDINHELFPDLTSENGSHLSLWDESGPVKDPETFHTRLKLLTYLARDISIALEHLRKMGVVHYDVKPENIIIYGGEKNTLEEVLAGKARFGLIDFGVTKPEGYQDPDLLVYGTPVYWAPEIVRMAATSAPIDTYALGITLAKGLTGHQPKIKAYNVQAFPAPGFSSPEIQSRYEELVSGAQGHVREDDLTLLAHLKDYIKGCLEFNPAKRPTERFHP